MCTLNEADEQADMKEPKTDLYPQPQQEQSSVPVERLSASSHTVIAICAAVAAFIVGWVTIRADISSNNKDLAALDKKVGRIEEALKAFSMLADLQREVGELKRNGSDNLHALQERFTKFEMDYRLHMAKYHPKEPDPMP